METNGAAAAARFRGEYSGAHAMQEILASHVRLHHCALVQRCLLRVCDAIPGYRALVPLRERGLISADV
ncbi:hypothetical protein NG831_00875 [Xanthomonas sacchari]|nr:hypothetical protein [Xanthomonas sacchari]UYK66817.1 hypothetical protein NG831_00875 [Xanthomonas sacchari]